jgi:hypothetical protein
MIDDFMPEAGSIGLRRGDQAINIHFTRGLLPGLGYVPAPTIGGSADHVGPVGIELEGP